MLLRTIISRSNTCESIVGSVNLCVISQRTRCADLISIFSNSRQNWIFKIAWMLLTVASMTFLLPVLFLHTFDPNRNDSFYTWPSNQFWEICLFGLLAVAIVMAFRFNWGPILPTTVFVSCIPCLWDVELIQLFTGLFIGIYLDVITFGVPDMRLGLKTNEITNG